MLDGGDPSGPKGRDSLLLAGDVGGTKVDLAVVSRERGARQPLAKRRYASASYASLAVISRISPAASSVLTAAAARGQVR